MKTATVGNRGNNCSKADGWPSDGEPVRNERHGDPAAEFGEPTLHPTRSGARGGVPEGEANQGFFGRRGKHQAREVADRHAGRDGDETVGKG